MNDIQYLHRFDIEAFRPGTATRFALLPEDAESAAAAEYQVPGIIMVGRRPGPKVVVAAGVHGDEYEGMAALQELAGELQPEDIGGTLLLLPVCNLSAFRAVRRDTPVDGLNLARVFPGSAEGSFSERLAHQIFQQLVLPFEALLDLHSGGSRLLHAPLSCFYDLPGQAGEKSLRAAVSLGFPYLWSVPLRSGVLSYEAARHGLLAVGTELHGGGRCLAADVGFYKQAVRRFLEYMQVLPATMPAAPMPEIYFVDDWLTAAATGFFRSAVELAERVEAGTLLGTISDPWGATLAELRSPHPGVVLGYRSSPPVAAGEILVFVLQEKKICDFLIR